MVFKLIPSGSQWYFKIIAPGNYKTLATSERYHNEADARHAAQLIINNAGNGRITK